MDTASNNLTADVQTWLTCIIAAQLMVLQGGYRLRCCNAQQFAEICVLAIAPFMIALAVNH
jgi:hypothetical protein